MALHLGPYNPAILANRLMLWSSQDKGLARWSEQHGGTCVVRNAQQILRPWFDSRYNYMGL